MNKAKRLFKPKVFSEIFDGVKYEISIAKLGVLEFQECQQKFRDLKISDLKKLGKISDGTEEEKEKLMSEFKFNDPTFLKSAEGFKAMIEKTLIKVIVDDNVFEGEDIEPILVQFDSGPFKWVADCFADVHKVLFEKKKIK